MLLVVAVFQVSLPVELLVRFVLSLPKAWEKQTKVRSCLASLTGYVLTYCTCWLRYSLVVQRGWVLMNTTAAHYLRESLRLVYGLDLLFQCHALLSQA